MSNIVIHYPLLKQVHISTVAISGILFVLRYLWMLQDRLQDKAGWIRTLPHVNDTFLLISGLAMATIIHQYPLVDGWLSVKFVALLSYIVLGSIALKRGRTKRIRILAGPAAIVCYLYIISAALSRSPLPSLEKVFQALTA